MCWFQCYCVTYTRFSNFHSRWRLQIGSADDCPPTVLPANIKAELSLHWYQQAVDIKVIQGKNF